MSEIAMLRRADRQVRVATVWHADRGVADEITELRRLLSNRDAA
ncbi:hypothetical protein [Mycobacterium shimoidei]|nr:hypothetical protein [Mycobacterium shimoidei]